MPEPLGVGLHSDYLRGANVAAVQLAIVLDTKYPPRRHVHATLARVYAMTGLRRTFYLEVDTHAISDRLNLDSPTGGFGSYSFAKAAEAVEEVLDAWCSANKINVVKKNSGWPLLQYVVDVAEAPKWEVPEPAVQ